MTTKKLIIILVVVGVIIYAFNLRGQLFWDDADWIVNNPTIQTFSLDNLGHIFSENVLYGIGLKSNYYRPVLMLTFMGNYLIHGIKPIGYHLVNNALHIANAIILFWLLNFLWRRKFIAFWVSLFFLVHPLQTEAVTYISGRGDPLHVFFMLLGLWFFVKNKRWLTLLMLVLALLSKETAIVFPFLALIVYLTMIGQGSFWSSLKRGLMKTWPYFALVTVYGVLRLTILNFSNTLNFASQANIYSESVIVRLLTFLRALTVYFRLLFVPLGQHMNRVLEFATSLWHWDVFLPLVVVVGLFGLLISWRGFQATPFRVWFFGLTWFFACMSPTMGLTPINAPFYEHWLYLALVGPLFLIFFYLAKLWDYLQEKNNWRVFIIVILSVLALGCSYLSIKRNVLWGKPVALFEDILKYEPNSVRILNDLGNIYFTQGNTTKAEEYYRKATTIPSGFAQPYYNLGRSLQMRGDIATATWYFQKAIEVDPNFPFAYGELGVIYGSQGDLESAKSMFTKMKALRPQDPRIYLNLAKIELVFQNVDQAKELLIEGLRYADSDPDAKSGIETLLKRYE